MSNPRYPEKQKIPVFNQVTEKQLPGVAVAARLESKRRIISGYVGR